MTDLLRILVAPLMWLASFSAVYGLQGLLCADGAEGAALGGVSLPRLVLVAAFGAAILAQVTLLVGLYAPRFASPSRFVRFVSRTTGWGGLVATIWSLLPVITASHCL